MQHLFVFPLETKAKRNYFKSSLDKSVIHNKKAFNEAGFRCISFPKSFYTAVHVAFTTTPFLISCTHAFWVSV